MASMRMDFYRGRGQYHATMTDGISPIGFVATPEILAQAISRLGRVDGLAIPLLDEGTRRFFRAAANQLPYRRAREVVGVGEQAVRQGFDLCFGLPDETPFHDLAAAFEDLTLAALALLKPSPIPLPFSYNDLVVQRYNPGDEGITPHRDHIAYRGLVALIILEMGGRFLTCPDRSGAESAEVTCPPGGVILMRAPGFEGRRDRPFHHLRDIAETRVSFGLRYDVRKLPGAAES